MIVDVVQFVDGVGSLVKGGVKLGGKIAKGAKAVKELEKGARLAELAKTFVAGAKGSSELNSAASKAAKVAKLRVVREAGEAKKVEKTASVAEKFHSELDVLKQRAREIPRTLTDDEIRACEAVKLQMKGKLPEPGKISVAEVEKIDEAVRAVNAAGEVEKAETALNCVNKSASGICGEAHNVVSYAKYKEVLKTTESANPLVESLRKTGELPQRYVTKAEAMAKGWKPGKALSNYIPGGQIGGDEFLNTTGVLPNASGRVWYEADVGLSDTMSRAKQQGTRLVYSNDGLMYVTYEHYKTMYPIGKWK